MKRPSLPRRRRELSRSALTAKRGRIRRNGKRKQSEFARIYGSRKRVAWIQSLECVVPGCGGRMSENAHTATGGMGRKADAETIVPMCTTHHRLLHTIGVATFSDAYSLDLPALAAETDHRFTREHAA